MAPTVLEWAGASDPGVMATMDGTSFAPQLRATVLWGYVGGQRDGCMDEWTVW